MRVSRLESKDPTWGVGRAWALDINIATSDKQCNAEVLRGGVQECWVVWAYRKDPSFVVGETSGWSKGAYG